MNNFHRQRLFSGIRDSHRVSIQYHWAYAIRKQARLSLLPLFREVIVCWKEGKTGKGPFLTELAEELFPGFSQSGSIKMSVHSQVEKIVSKFLESLDKQESGVLGFYFLSKNSEVDAIFQESLESGEFEETSTEENDEEVGRTFLQKYQQLSKDELSGFLMEELGEIENILSNSDLECGLDAEAITRINEQFSNYLDLPYGEISLIRIPGEEWDYWKKVTAEEPETVGKRIQTSNGLEWAECWLLADGSIRVKGNLEDPGERNQAAIHLIRQELSEVLKAVHEQLIKHYELFDSHIHYTFFTRRETLENVVPVEGIQFFVDQIEAHESDDFEPRINLDIRRYKDKMLQEWGTQISLGIEDRHWLTEDEKYEFKVWVLTMEGEETHLEIRFSEDQKEAIVQEIQRNINESYQHRNEA